MRAIVIATGQGPGVAPLDERYPVPLLPLVDRPFIQHVIEYFAAQGVKRFDFVRSHLPEKLEQYLGDGKRWGSQFTYHLVRDPERPYRLLKTLDLSGEQQTPILLGHADRLPEARLESLIPEAKSRPVLFFYRDTANGDRRWTGWALVSPDDLVSLPSDADETAFWEHLQRDHEPHWIEVPPPLATSTFDGIMQAHEAVLSGQFPGLLLGGQRCEPGVWLSRNVVLHPTAQIVQPVYIGENCQIGAGVKLGPLAVVARDCMLDTHSTVQHSLIYPGSYVGQGLELADVIVDKNRLVNVRVGGAMTVSDIFILGNLAERHVRRGAQRLASQVAGAILLFLLSPMLLFTAVVLKLTRSGPVLYRAEVVRLPTSTKETSWRTYRLWSFLPNVPPNACGLGYVFLRLLPGLVNVARGDLGFVGLPPRSADEVCRLTDDWQSLYVSGKAGLITEAALQTGPDATQDETFMAEAFYTAAATWKYDLKLLVRYLGRCLLKL